MHKGSVLYLVAILLLSILLGALLGNLLMLGIASMNGISFDSMDKLFDLFEDDEYGMALKVGLGISHFCTFTLSSLLFWKIISDRPINEYFYLNKKYDFSKQIVFISLLICTYPLIVASVDIFRFIELPEWMNLSDESQLDSLSKVLEMNSPSDLLLNILIVAVLPAIGEELLFRGIIQKEMIKHIPNKYLAIFIASFVFAAVHLQITGFMPKLLIGLILGFVLLWTGNILYCMVLHFLNNGLPLIAYYMVGSEGASSTETTDLNPASTYLGALISIFLIYFLVIYIQKNIQEDEPKA